MSRSILIWFLALMLAGLWLAGCSDSGNITAPEQGEEPIKEATAPEGVFQRYLWDIGEVVIDTAKQTVDVPKGRGLQSHCTSIHAAPRGAGQCQLQYQLG